MSRSNAVGKLRQIIEQNEGEKDIKAALFSALGNDIGDVFHAQVLVATYPGERYHAGTKIIRTDTSIQENRFQGTIFLVVAKGPGAFKDDGQFKFHGKDIEVGDWVLAKPSDGTELFIKEVPCRLFEDSCIKMKVSDPTLYW
jgi:co-chaperonin GroES (HSP10)